MTVTKGRGHGSIRVFLLDDHEVVRRSVQELLQMEGDIVGGGGGRHGR